MSPTTRKPASPPKGNTPRRRRMSNPASDSSSTGSHSGAPHTGTRKIGWIRRLVTIAGLVAATGLTFALFAVAGLQMALRFREVTVPDLSGRSVEQATETLAATGLTVRVESLSRIDPSIPAGRIADQDPASDLTTRNGRTVKVWLSSGTTAGSVPALLGQSEQDALARLEEDALELRGVSEIRSNRYPSGAVVAQDPPPQGAAPSVSVLVNRGERGATYVMPDLIGVYGTHAANVLRSRGFRVTVVGDHPYPGVEAGVVLRQFPRAGFQIANGEAISLEVSR